MKNTIKRLSNDIEIFLGYHNGSEEMDTLYGGAEECSHGMPNFSELIEKYSLTSETLNEMLAISETHAKTWFEKYPTEHKITEPKTRKEWETMHSFQYMNPWYLISCNLCDMLLTDPFNENVIGIKQSYYTKSVIYGN